MGIMRGLRKKEKRSAEVVERPVSLKRADAPPPLMLLLPDAGGIATYTLNQFPSAKAAEYYLDSTLRGQLGEGAVLFWALNRQPVMGGVGGVDIEPLVVIRDVKRAVVYPFSFSDLESAHDFIRHEMRRGLDMGQVMVYWAVPARIEVDFWGRSTIIPPAPPSRHADTAGTVVPFTQPTATMNIPSAIAEAAVAEPEPEPEPALAPEIPEEIPHYLTESDIAEAVKMMNQLTDDGPADESEDIAELDRVLQLPVSDTVIDGPGVELDHEAEVIDFTSTSQKLHETRHARQAWHNFSLALDEALDVYVGKQVIIKLCWNRIGRALVEAALAAERARLDEEELHAAREESQRRAGIVRTWSNTGVALHEAVGERKRQVGAMAVGNMVNGLRDSLETHAARRAGTVTAVSAMTAALTDAAHASEKRRGLRKAWLNASWTLEEACYAHALEQKARSIRAWRFLSAALVEAAQAQEVHHAALRVCWSNAGFAIGEATRAYYMRLQMFQEAWSGATRELHAAVTLALLIARQKLGAANFAAALGEALAAKAHCDELTATWHHIAHEIIAACEASFARDRAVAAWGNAAEALDGVCRAYVQKQKMAIRAWKQLAVAFGGALEAKFRQDAAISAWTNATVAMCDYAIAKSRHDAAVAAWTNAGAVIVEAVVARVRYEGLVAAWTNAGAAAREAVATHRRCAFLRDAWNALADSFALAVKVMIARQAALERAWRRLTVAFVAAANAKAFRDASVAAWTNATAAIIEMTGAYMHKQALIQTWTHASAALIEAVPCYHAQQRAIAAWSNAGVAFKEAVVAEAKLRIAEAGLDKLAMAEVDKTVKAAQKAVKEATKAGKTTRRSGGNGSGNGNDNGKHAEETPAAPEPVLEAPVSEMKLRHAVFVPKPVEQAAEVATTVDPVAETAEDVEVVEIIEVVEEAAKEEVTNGPATSDDNKDVGGGWRIRDGGRWEPREAPFRGFQSPPGRFYRKEREDKPSI